MSSDNIPTVKAEDFVSDTVSVSEVGSITLDTIRGRVDADEFPGMTTLMIRKDDGCSIAVLVYEPALSVGAYVQLDAAMARKVAGNLVHLANLIDPAGVN